MRISDWSSDVCSSDLFDGNGILHPRGLGEASHVGVMCNIQSIGVAKTLFHVDGLDQHQTADRKSVVYGTSVSVRVDHGGRRIKKKKKRKRRKRAITTG